MAATLHILEKEGFNVLVEKSKLETTSAVIYGEAIRFGLIERSRQIKPAIAPDPKGRISTAYVYNPIKFEPTKQLSIEIWSYCAVGLRKVWRDGDRASLEEQLPKCIAGMIRVALHARAERDAEEKEEAAKQKQIDEVTNVLRRIQEEETKIKSLKRDAAAWWQAERIRNYIATVRTAAGQQPNSTEKTKLLEWIDWAEQQANRIDPLKKSPDSIVDEKDRVIRRLQELRWHW